LTKSLSNDNFLLAKVKKIFRKKKGAIMKRTAKLRKIFATITDIFIFSVLVRVIFYGCLQSEGQMQLSLFLSLLIGGFVNYVLIPFYLKSRTLGMKMNGLVYKFVKKTNLENLLILSLRFGLQLCLNILFLGIPLAINLFLMLWRQDGTTFIDQLFAKVMVNQELN
jgi:hypothetical protein